MIGQGGLITDPLAIFIPGATHLLAVLVACAIFTWTSRRIAFSARFRGFVIAMVLWCWVFATPGLANLALAALEGQPGDGKRAVADRHEGNVVVVLSSGTLYSRDGRPAPRLSVHGWERLDAGIALWRSVGGTLLLTGGPEGDPARSLAGIMRRVAIESGVPSESIVISPRARTTREELEHAGPEIARHPGRAILVTSALHMPRAQAVAARLGLSMGAHPCDYRQVEKPTWRIWIPSAGAAQIWSLVLHEIVGLQYYRWRGWAN